MVFGINLSLFLTTNEIRCHERKDDVGDHHIKSWHTQGSPGRRCEGSMNNPDVPARRCYYCADVRAPYDISLIGT